MKDSAAKPHFNVSEGNGFTSDPPLPSKIMLGWWKIDAKPTLDRM